MKSTVCGNSETEFLVIRDLWPFLINVYCYALMGNWFFNFSQWEVMVWNLLGKTSMLYHQQMISGEETRPMITLCLAIMASNTVVGL